MSILFFIGIDYIFFTFGAILIKKEGKYEPPI